MTPDEIKLRMSEIRVQYEALEAEVKALQEQCEHPEFTRGLTMIACVQEVDLCTTCGWAKPIMFDHDLLDNGDGYAVYTSRN